MNCIVSNDVCGYFVLFSNDWIFLNFSPPDWTVHIPFTNNFCCFLMSSFLEKFPQTILYSMYILRFRWWVCSNVSCTMFCRWLSWLWHYVIGHIFASTEWSKHCQRQLIFIMSASISNCLVIFKPINCFINTNISPYSSIKLAGLDYSKVYFSYFSIQMFNMFNKLRIKTVVFYEINERVNDIISTFQCFTIIFIFSGCICCFHHLHLY